MQRRCWPWWTVLLWVAMWVVGVLAVSIARASCHQTTQRGARDGGNSASFSEGYRVISMRWDPVLQRRWTLIESCKHPEWPVVAVPVSDFTRSLAVSQRRALLAGSILAAPVVRAGDAVQLWSEQGNLRIEVAAIAEQSGALGQGVRVRLAQRETLGQQTEEEFTGVVRGPHDVEMQP